MFLEPTNVHLILFIEKKGISLLKSYMYGNFLINHGKINPNSYC